MSDEFAVACSGCGAKWLSRASVPPLDHCPRCPVSERELDAIIQGLERIKSLEAEVARLRLTDAEREAIGYAAKEADANLYVLRAATLRGLLERTK